MTTHLETPTVSVLTDRIAQRLDEIGQPPVWLAGQLRISEATVRRWYRGEFDPRASLIPDIALFLGVSVEWLQGLDSRRQPPLRPVCGYGDPDAQRGASDAEALRQAEADARRAAAAAELERNPD